LTTPILGAGKIGTADLAEDLLQRGACDIIGMARALLADPYMPGKVAAGRDADVVRCIYCNVCKSLDENFKTVVCYLWPKGAKHAPSPDEARADVTWPEGGAQVQVTAANGEIRLRWNAAQGAAVGYDVLRAEGDGPYERLTACTRTAQLDDSAMSGRDYRYRIVPYDAAGRRGIASDAVEAML
jgi:hypothetical protein